MKKTIKEKTKEQLVGGVTQYDHARRRAEVKLCGTLCAGNPTHIKSHRSDWHQSVESMYLGEKPIAKGRAGQLIWLGVIKRAHKGDKVFIVLGVDFLPTPGPNANTPLDGAAATPTDPSSKPGRKPNRKPRPFGSKPRPSKGDKHDANNEHEDNGEENDNHDGHPHEQDQNNNDRDQDDNGNGHEAKPNHDGAKGQNDKQSHDDKQGLNNDDDYEGPSLPDLDNFFVDSEKKKKKAGEGG